MQKYIANPKYVLRKIMDEYILIPIESNGKVCRNIITANETVAFIWGLLSERISKSELVKALTDEYEVTKQTAEKDIEELLEKMQQHGIVHTVHST